MKHVTRLASVCLAASLALCLTTVFYSSAQALSPAHLTRATVKGSVVSSPSSGPVGAIIAISGSGWSDPDGEQVSFGYMIASYCSIVPDSQAGTFDGGSFSGWLRWPGGTPLGIYPVCATFGSTTAQANTYTVLSESAPQVSISPSILTAGTQATVTGSNFYPAGTNVQLSWETVNGSVSFGLSPAISNSTGSFSKIFVVPTTSLASGSYRIVAVVGGSQPPTLSSSTTFTYHVLTPTLSPTPTPSPTPRANPTPVQQVTPTATTHAVASPTSIPTIVSTTLPASQDTSTGQTPTSGTSTNTTPTNQPISTLLVAGVIGLLGLLAVILVIVLLIRRKKAHSNKLVAEVGTPTTSNMSFPMNNGLNTLIQPWPVPTANGGYMNPVSVGQIAQPINGHPPFSNQATPLSPQQLHVSPYAHLLHRPDEGSASVNDPPTLTPNDADFEAIKRQVQTGLFAIPGQRWNEEPS
jgi:hypothetical protein